MSSTVPNNITFNNPYGDLTTSKAPSTVSVNSALSLSPSYKNITLDKYVIITCGDKQVQVGDLFRKLEILDKIIKNHYPEELMI